MSEPQRLDLIIIGAGIAGVTALHYARAAGLNAQVFERQNQIGGLWAQLPPWQDIQIAAVDWALGDIALADTFQPAIRDNIEGWVRRFGLMPFIRLGTPVQRARRVDDGWEIETPAGRFVAPNLISATGAHNRPIVPEVERAGTTGATVRELHSSQLMDPAELRGRDVVVVGGGASGYDMLDLCFQHGARRVVWVYRGVRWMLPTLKPKRVGGTARPLFQLAVSGLTDAQISKGLDKDIRERYERFGLMDILPEGKFTLEHLQLIPGRSGMIENFAKIERHPGEVRRIEGRHLTLSDGTGVEADLLLWGTGYAMDMSYFESPALAGVRDRHALERQCGGLVRSLHEPGLFFMSVGLEGTGAAPHAYAHLARTMVAHIQGKAQLGLEPVGRNLNYFTLLRYLAQFDPHHYPPGWEAEYRHQADTYAPEQPLPIPV